MWYVTAIQVHIWGMLLSGSVWAGVSSCPVWWAAGTTANRKDTELACISKRITGTFWRERFLSELGLCLSNTILLPLEQCLVLTLACISVLVPDAISGLTPGSRVIPKVMATESTPPPRVLGFALLPLWSSSCPLSWKESQRGSEWWQHTFSSSAAAINCNQ